MALYFRAGLYADFGINIYYLVVAVYGWMMWRYGHGKKEKSELPITPMPLRHWLLASLAAVAAFFAIAFILINFTDSTVPWLDAFTTALSIVGLWMLARKYIEQWWVWLVVDVVTCGLYIYKGLCFNSALYGIYSVIAIFGYLKWKRLMAAQD
jgi:nicotinamide mononucleotide transporter